MWYSSEGERKHSTSSTMSQTELIRNLKPNYQLIYWNTPVFRIWLLFAICSLLVAVVRIWELIRSEEEKRGSEGEGNLRGWLGEAVGWGVTCWQMRASGLTTWVLPLEAPRILGHFCLTKGSNCACLCPGSGLSPGSRCPRAGDTVTSADASLRTLFASEWAMLPWWFCPRTSSRDADGTDSHGPIQHCGPEIWGISKTSSVLLNRFQFCK